MLANVTLELIDGALGVQPPQVGEIAAVFGTSSQGPINVPDTFTSKDALIATYGDGPMVECAANLLAFGGRQVVVCRTEQDLAQPDAEKMHGSNWDSIAGHAPQMDLDVVIELLGTGPLTESDVPYRLSMDGGRTWINRSSDESDTVVLPYGFPDGPAHIQWAGTAAPGLQDYVRFFAPVVTDLDDTLAALRDTHHAWDIAVPAAPVSSLEFGKIAAFIDELWSKGRFRKFIANTKRRGVNQTETAWESAIVAEFGSSESKFGMLAAGDAMISSQTGHGHPIRRASWAVAGRALATKNPRRVDISAPNIGPLPSAVQILNIAQNVAEHNEEQRPTLDDHRFVTLRTMEGMTGTYITNAKTFAPIGSDFDLWQYTTAIMDIARVVRQELIRFLKAPIRVDKKTGCILELDAIKIEKTINAAVEALVGEGPDVSGHEFRLSRTDQILATRKLHGSERIIPLGYPTQIAVDIGMANPARVVVV